MAAAEECHLRFLMINGRDFRLVVPETCAVRDVKQRVIDDRPPELLNFLKVSPPGNLPPPTKIDEIRILHLGKFMEDAKTLKESNFSTGPGAENETTVHINCRLPTNALDDVKDKLNKKSGSCCVVM